jgi:hypothetical protein
VRESPSVTARRDRNLPPGARGHVPPGTPPGAVPPKGQPIPPKGTPPPPKEKEKEREKEKEKPPPV